MESHVSQCMEKAYACVTHGMPCVNMHGTFESYKYGSSNSVRGSSKIQFIGATRRRRTGKEKGRKGKEKGRKRKEKERRKEKKKKEEERKKKEEKGKNVAQ